MDLFSQYKLGNIKLSNRMVMAPMARCRAVEGIIPNPVAIAYYVQRAQSCAISYNFF
jgi:N-ethylmaleimide reductase